MKQHLFPVSVVLIGTTLAAQPNYTVTPRGTDLVELVSSTSIALNYSRPTRVQQADNAHVGTKRVLRSIAWRRNGTAAKTVTHTPTLTLKLAHCDYSKFTTTFSTNYKGTPTTVFSGSRKLDWTKASTLPVGLWSDATFPFSKVFVYNGSDALLWESATTSITNTTAAYAADWGGTAPATRSWLIPEVLGAGCKTNNGTMTLTGSITLNATPQFTMQWSVSGASSSSVTRVYTGLTDPNVGLLCGKLHTDGSAFFLPLPNTSTAGATTATFTGPWLKFLAGAAFTAQAICFDASAPGGGYLSNGIFGRLPKAVGGTALLSKRTFSLSSATAVAGSSVSTSSQATQFK